MTGTDYLATLKISSSWIGGHGDIYEVGTRRAPSGGEEPQPRKRKGRRQSVESRLELQQQAANARDRRRAGRDAERL